MSEVSTTETDVFFDVALSSQVLSVLAGDIVSVGVIGFSTVSMTISDDDANTFSEHPDSPLDTGGFFRVQAWETKIAADNASYQLTVDFGGISNVATMKVSIYRDRAATFESAEGRSTGTSFVTTFDTPALAVTGGADAWLFVGTDTNSPGTLTPASGYSIPTGGGVSSTYYKCFVGIAEALSAGSSTPSVDGASATLSNALAFAFPLASVNTGIAPGMFGSYFQMVQ